MRRQGQDVMQVNLAGIRRDIMNLAHNYSNAQVINSSVYITRYYLLIICKNDNKTFKSNYYLKFRKQLFKSEYVKIITQNLIESLLSFIESCTKSY